MCVHPWVGKISWWRTWQPTPVFLPGESHGRRAWWATVHRVTQSLTRLKGFSSVKFSSVTQSCPTLCDPMYCSMPDLPVHHHLLEFTQTFVHQVGDVIQPSHPLSSPSPPAPHPSQHQSFPMSQLFAVMAKVLEFQLQHQSFQ